MVRFAILVILFFQITFSADEVFIYAFKSATSVTAEKMIVVGETISFDKASLLEDKQEYDLKVDTRQDIVTIKVTNGNGLKVGQTIYLVEKNFDHNKFSDGNIVGQVEILSLFDTSFFGKQLRGKGFLSMAKEKTLVAARSIALENKDTALVFFQKGNYYLKKLEYANAILYYKKAIEDDKNFPEPHYKLAVTYFRSDKSYTAASFEFLRAYQEREYFNNSFDKLSFYVDYMNFIQEKYKNSFAQKSELTKIPQLSKEALNINSTYAPLLKTSITGYLLINNELNGDVNLKETRENYTLNALKIQSYLDQLFLTNSNDLDSHYLAILFYFELFKLAQVGQIFENPLDSDVDSLKNKIEKHLSIYLKFKPSYIDIHPEIEFIIRNVQIN